jgi:hypothetical protein
MFSRWLVKTLASLLTAVLFLAVISVVFHTTIFNAKYIEGQLDRTNAYNRLSVALSDQVSQQAGVAGNAQLSGGVSNVLQPAALKQKVNTALAGYQAYYEGKGGVPQLDLTGLAAQAQAQGVPLPANTTISQPISFASSNDQGAQNVGKAIAGARTTTLVLGVALVLVLAVLSWRTRRYRTLPNVLISVGFFLGLMALAFWLGPTLVQRYVPLVNGSNAFLGLGRDLAQNIGHDLARRFGVLFAVFEVAGAVLRIWAGRAERAGVLAQQFGKPAKPGTIKN